MAHIIPWYRPVESQKVRLYYNQSPPIKQRCFALRDPLNILIQLRIYRWSRSVDFYNQVEKDWLMAKLFYDSPRITQHRVGRFLSTALQYRPHQQVNKSHQNDRIKMVWRFFAAEELQYGTEYMMLTWLPDLVTKLTGEIINTPELFEEELAMIIKQPLQDDLANYVLPSMECNFQLTRGP